MIGRCIQRLGRRATSASSRECRASVVAFAVTALLCAMSPPAMAQIMAADHHLRAQPENLSWGWIPTDKPPVLMIQSGETVRIDTISHHGSTQDEDPVDYLGRYGVESEEILQDVRDFWASRPERPREGRTGAHVLTGPIAIAGAEPGDMLEIQILEVSTRVPYGFNGAKDDGAPSRIVGIIKSDLTRTCIDQQRRLAHDRSDLSALQSPA